MNEPPINDDLLTLLAFVEQGFENGLRDRQTDFSTKPGDKTAYAVGYRLGNLVHKYAENVAGYASERDAALLSGIIHGLTNAKEVSPVYHQLRIGARDVHDTGVAIGWALRKSLKLKKRYRKRGKLQKLVEKLNGWVRGEEHKQPILHD